MSQFEALDAWSWSMPLAHNDCHEQPGERSLMAEQVKAGVGVLDAAATMVDDHRVNQNMIATRIRSAADECQASWVGQGAAAATQVIVQFMEEHRRAGQALLRLPDGLRSTGATLMGANSEVATGARRLDFETVSSYRNLP